VLLLPYSHPHEPVTNAGIEETIDMVANSDPGDGVGLFGSKTIVVVTLGAYGPVFPDSSDTFGSSFVVSKVPVSQRSLATHLERKRDIGLGDIVVTVARHLERVAFVLKSSIHAEAQLGRVFDVRDQHYPADNIPHLCRFGPYLESPEHDRWPHFLYEFEPCTSGDLLPDFGF
jgi:hypothetical protein